MEMIQRRIDFLAPIARVEIGSKPLDPLEQSHLFVDSGTEPSLSRVNAHSLPPACGQYVLKRWGLCLRLADIQ